MKINLKEEKSDQNILNVYFFLKKIQNESRELRIQVPDRQEDS